MLKQMLKQWIMLAFVLVASPPLIAQTASPAAQQGGGPEASQQPAAKWQRKRDMTLQYRSLADFYAAMKKESASKQRAPLPDWAGIWTADSVDSFAACLGGSQCYFRSAPGGTVGPKLALVAIADL